MITEKELLLAIKECEAEPITGSKVSKLADLYIIYDHLFGEPQEVFYSTKGQAENLIETDSGSDFLEAINGRPADKVWVIVDEAMQAVKTLHPKMFDRIIERITAI